MDAFWQLPGPHRFVDAVKANLGDGRNVVLILPSPPPRGIKRAMYQKLCEEWQWRDLPVPSGRPPIDAVSERFDRDAAPYELRSVERLMLADDFDGCLVWLDGLRQTDWPAWKRFLDEYQHACRSQAGLRRSLFLVPLEGEIGMDAPSEDVCLALHRWDGAVDHLDMLIYATLRLHDRPWPNRQRQLLASTLAHIAVWDPRLVDSLGQADAAQILEPQALLRGIAFQWGWSHETPIHWAHGTEAHLDGRAEVHSALLALTEPKRIEQRLWHAQVGVLLPLIEEHRQRLLQDLRPVITSLAEARTPIDIDQLEIGELAHLCKNLGGRMDPDLRRRVQRLRDLRNRLAHLQPAPASDVLARDLYAS